MCGLSGKVLDGACLPPACLFDHVGGVGKRNDIAFMQTCDDDASLVAAYQFDVLRTKALAGFDVDEAAAAGFKQRLRRNPEDVLQTVGGDREASGHAGPQFG